MTALSERPEIGEAFEPIEPAVFDGDDPRRWITLAIATTSVMIVSLDMTVLNVAIPTILRDFHNWVTVSNGVADLRCENGTMTAPDAAGLGVEVDVAALGEPLLMVR